MKEYKHICKSISIHALLAESDGRTWQPKKQRQHFYPRSPCGERLSMRGAFFIDSDISIHALLAESDRRFLSCADTFLISIHALLAESDNGEGRN